MTMSKIITHKILASWNACEEGYEFFCKLFPTGATAQEAIVGLFMQGKPYWARWLYEQCKADDDFEDPVTPGLIELLYTTIMRLDWKKPLNLQIRADKLSWFIIMLIEKRIETTRQQSHNDGSRHLDASDEVASLTSWRMDLEMLMDRIKKEVTK
jgi:hypothetical protein